MKNTKNIFEQYSTKMKKLSEICDKLSDNDIAWNYYENYAEYIFSEELGDCYQIYWDEDGYHVTWKSYDDTYPVYKTLNGAINCVKRKWVEE